MGRTNNFSVVANLSHLGVQICKVIHVCDSSHNNHTQAYYKSKRVNGTIACFEAQSQEDSSKKFKVDDSNLFGYEVVEEINWWWLEKYVVQNGIVEETRVFVSETTCRNQQREGHWNGQVDWKGVAESLDHDFASKFA